MHKLKIYFYIVFFIFGWGLFYLFELGLIFQLFFDFNKIAEMYSFSYNLIYSFVNFILLICYSFIFVKYFKIFFGKQVHLKQKGMIIARSCIAAIVFILILTLVVIVLVKFKI